MLYSLSIYSPATRNERGIGKGRSNKREIVKVEKGRSNKRERKIKVENKEKRRKKR